MGLQPNLSRASFNFLKDHIKPTCHQRTTGNCQQKCKLAADGLTHKRVHMYVRLSHVLVFLEYCNALYSGLTQSALFNPCGSLPQPTTQPVPHHIFASCHWFTVNFRLDFKILQSPHTQPRPTKPHLILCCPAPPLESSDQPTEVFYRHSAPSAKSKATVLFLSGPCSSQPVKALKTFSKPMCAVWPS